MIGLLFVAISVVPHGVRTSGRATVRLRPAAALSAFTNALLISLLALVPGLDLAGVVTALSTAGLVAMAVLLVLLARDVRGATPGPKVWAFVAVVGQGVLYGFQLAQGIALRGRPDDVAAVADVAVLVVVLFALGIERAWEYVGGYAPGLLAAVGRLESSTPPGTDTDTDADTAAPPASGERPEQPGTARRP